MITAYRKAPEKTAPSLARIEGQLLPAIIG